MFSCMVRIPQDIQLLVSVTKLANTNRIEIPLLLSPSKQGISQVS